MLIALDNVESLLDPRGPNAEDIYSTIEELGEFSNISLLITSRISTIPPNCETLEVPTLPMEAARDTFYRIYKRGEQSDSANDILEKLDFHPLSITLLATVAHQSKWGISRLTKEWESRRTSLLRTEHSKSLAATIELSLASPMFQNLGPDAREFLGVVAFYPQGVDENNLDWFFPAIPNRTEIFDKFCILSLAHRSEGFIKMLAPLRDYLSPKDPLSSTPLCTTKDCYLTRLSGPFDPAAPDFGETRWIMSEDGNVEHLLDTIASIDPHAKHVWDACANFMLYLYYHKPRLLILGPKIERLPDAHPSKPQCLRLLIGLAGLTGNGPEFKRLLAEARKFWIDPEAPDGAIVRLLDSGINPMTREEKIQLTQRMVEVMSALRLTLGQITGLVELSGYLREANRLDAALETASRALALLPENAPKHLTLRCHHMLGEAYHSKGPTEKAIEHFEVALGLASSHDRDEEAFHIYRSLTLAFLREGRLDDANAHLERAKLRAANDPLCLADVMSSQAGVLFDEGRVEEAESEMLRVVDIYQELGNTTGAEIGREFLTTMRGIVANKGYLSGGMSGEPFFGAPDPNGMLNPSKSCCFLHSFETDQTATHNQTTLILQVWISDTQSRLAICIAWSALHYCIQRLDSKGRTTPRVPA